MMPSENDEEVELDSRYIELVDEMATGKVPREEAFHLHMWLSDQVTEHMLQQAITTAVGTETLAEQIKVCTTLKIYASAIAERFDFLRQVSSVEFAMSQVFNSVEPKGVSHNQLSSASKPEHWNTFRDRLTADTALLAEVARRTVAELKARGSKKGRHVKDWRNKLFTELVDRLLLLGGGTHEACTDLACRAWNVYFRNASINSPETAGKIVTRERQRRKIQGQNAS